MSSGPELSVIVPNYNKGPYLKECLDSILSQTFHNLEIIVSDDASTDHSQEIIRDYVKRFPGKIRAVFSPENRGVSLTRHAAVLQARGKYISTLDGDDVYYIPTKLENELSLIHHYKETYDKDICAFSNTVHLDKNLNFIKETVRSNNLREGNIFNEMLTRSCVVPLDFVYLKSAYFEVGGYDPEFKIREDWDLKIRLARKYEYYYTGRHGTGVRLHFQGLSSSDLNRDPIVWLRKAFEKNLPLAAETDREEITRQFEAFIQRRQRHLEAQREDRK